MTDQHYKRPNRTFGVEIALLFGTIALSIFLLGCDKLVSRQVHHDRSYVVQQKAPCNYFGYCYHCGMDLDGELSCGFKLTSFCHGSRPETTRVIPVTEKYESGVVRDTFANQTVSIDGPCK